MEYNRPKKKRISNKMRWREILKVSRIKMGHAQFPTCKTIQCCPPNTLMAINASVTFRCIACDVEVKRAPEFCTPCIPITSILCSPCIPYTPKLCSPCNPHILNLLWLLDLAGLVLLLTVPDAPPFCSSNNQTSRLSPLSGLHSCLWRGCLSLSWT